MTAVDPIAISRSALDVEWQRMQVIAQNLANQSSSRVGGGSSYIPLTLVSGPRGDFNALISAGKPAAMPQGIRILTIEPQPGGTRRVHSPGNPDADRDGFVTLPNVNIASEMALLVKTARVYESNLTALSLVQQMARRALEIGNR